MHVSPQPCACRGGGGQKHMENKSVTGEYLQLAERKRIPQSSILLSSRLEWRGICCVWYLCYSSGADSRGMIACGACDNMECLCQESERRLEQNAIVRGAATWTDSRLQAKFKLIGTSDVLMLLLIIVALCTIKIKCGG